MLKKTAETVLETSFGDFQLRLYAEEETGKEHVVLFKSWADHIPLVRIHSKCLTGDTFASKYCDCGQQLHLA
ncbi:MAG: bifunctional 3,4-dihydroxy-2-butanone-4-phosphate synthase/GTP cyclohydrolase II, partial [Candidatus Gracilibacteria bacterium]|nr:bifunctional 3,4-dihydroxy-2-butanone-4-phosphate synthase/GTP cyclohydrolase II [Candidatus Gracilibacteria bacterium]